MPTGQSDRRTDARTLQSSVGKKYRKPSVVVELTSSVTLPAVGHKCLLIIENRDVPWIDGINQSIMSKPRRVERDFVPILA